MANAGAIDAVGYVRVSTDEQHLGPEAQRAELQRWCSSNGAQLVAVHSDHGVSGAAPLDRRPGLLSALDALSRGAVLLVSKRDRLARDPIVSAMVERMVERRGARVVSCAGEGNGDGPADQLMRRMVDAFAEYERAIIRARTRAALAVKRSRGERTGGSLPFGWTLARDGRTLKPHAREQAAIALILELRAAGSSWRRVADELTGRGVATKRGGAWTGAQARAAAALAGRWTGTLAEAAAAA